MIRVLCVRSAFLGDIVLSTASVSEIKHQHPQWELTYMIWGINAPLLSLNPNVDRLVTAGTYMISDYQFAVDFRHESLMHKYPETYWGELHARQASGAGSLDLDKMKSFKPELFVGPSDLVDTSDLGDFAVINVFTKNGVGWRLWDFNKWEKLVVELQKTGFKVVQLGGQADPKIDGVDVQLCGKAKLAQSISVVASADLVIGIDSFVMHCAHATKYINDIENGKITKIRGSTPAILLAGPIDWHCVVPTDAKCIPITNYPDCSGPCGFSHAKAAGRRICQFNNSCMKNITVEKVMEGVEALDIL